MDSIDYYSSLSPEAKAWVSNQEELIHAAIRSWLNCCVSAIAVPGLVILLANVQPADIPGWIQRSGTVVLVFSILAEIKVQAVRRAIFVVDANRLYCDLHIEGKFGALMPYIQYSTYFLIAFGTLITGYGDLIYQIFFN